MSAQARCTDCGWNARYRRPAAADRAAARHRCAVVTKRPRQERQRRTATDHEVSVQTGSVPLRQARSTACGCLPPARGAGDELTLP